MRRNSKSDNTTNIEYHTQKSVNLIGNKEIEFTIHVEDNVSAEEIIEALTRQNNSLQPLTKKIDIIKNNTNNKTVLVIGDIHEPFCHDDYLDFCQEQYKKYNCDTVVFIGDVIDNHFMSFHTSDPDGFGGGEELDRAIYKISRWYKAFPNATVIIGNHDRLAFRKAYSSGISSKWVRDYDEVLNTPNWNFVDRIVIDNVLYIHGESGTARMKAKDINRSVVQGHLHSQAYIEYINNDKFAMQVGTGVDDSKYAFAYNKAGKESILSCGIIKEGTQPFLIKMN